jgi:Flp pilus assembly protein TadD
MNEPLDDRRVQSPGNDEESLREYGRQLALDSLLELALGSHEVQKLPPGEITSPSDTARLREQSAAAEQKGAEQKRTVPFFPPQPLSRSFQMSSKAWRMVAATSAAILLIVAGIWSSNLARAPWTLGDVLDNLANARSVHFNLTVADRSGEAWATHSKQMRWNYADGTYRIAQDKSMWLIDESANQAVFQPCAFFRAEKSGLDSLALVGLTDEKNRAQVLSSRPVEEVEQDGAKCYCYRVEIVSIEVKRIMHVEAVVDAATRMLRSLETRVDRDGRIEPVAKLTVLGLNEPVKEELFVVGDTLTEDGRIGKVIDAQGIVSVKPVMARRWTPVQTGLLLKGGDWLQADLRGANAAAVRLVKQTTATLGPGALVEFVKPTQIRLYSGDLKIAAGENETIELTGPDKKKVQVKGTALYHIDQEKLARLDKEPLWLKGFEGSAVNESIGSLVAKVDGRNVPLTMGYHKVTVDIRDQIARTEIEESFVNHTDGRLEGQFIFPLPQDASISGFGMWIGNNLVEADIVEKQRAREIYETILRENRDPGLLEWSGGNIFKARVFPIEPHSEKRIKISYTQVLPLRDNSFRYSYALQSELLKQHPLRELAIDVRINSAIPLANVASPTHMSRIDKTEHSGHVEFTAQQYTPKNDFEVVVDVDGQQSEVVLSPHRRGEDGYFMLLVTPPGTGESARGLSHFRAPSEAWSDENGTVPLSSTVLSSAAAKREILPEAEPLELLILADTSASLDAGARTAQTEFIAALLGSLGPADAVNLACADVDCDWAFEKLQPAEAKNVEAARKFLADRVSLGWTDLDKAFASAINRCGVKTRVVYVGDGIPTTGDADPVAFCNRLRRMYEKKGAFYAVSVGSSYESGVLKTIASLGGGSMRQISGQSGPRAVALELLGEFARPGLRDLKVEFHGLHTARVYPEQLPNVPAGSQQIILGRYLPEGSDQSGEIVVTGMQGDREMKLTSKVSLKDAEQGNSFIPRLWARMYLDSLLQQGNSQAIQDEIIALSEEYHIITPYTSLLVLESDADRERFKVTPRFQMRDGEKFFAKGRDNANYELLQQQMKRAGNWRIGLRNSVLQQFIALGRDPAALGSLCGALDRGYQGGAAYAEFADFDSLIDSITETVSPARWQGENTYGDRELSYKSISSKKYFFAQKEGKAGLDLESTWLEDRASENIHPFQTNLSIVVNAPEEVYDDFDGNYDQSGNLNRLSEAKDVVYGYGDNNLAEIYEDLFIALSLQRQRGVVDTLASVESSRIPFEPLAPGLYSLGSDYFQAILSGGSLKIDGLNQRVLHDSDWTPGLSLDIKSLGDFDAIFRKRSEELQIHRKRIFAGGGRREKYDSFTSAIDRLFPALPPAPEKTPEPKRRWPAEARALAESLLRTEQLAKLSGGLEIQRRYENYEPRWSELTSRQQTLQLVSPGAWLIRENNESSQTTVNWCDGKQRGVLGLAFQLGMVRDSTASDLARPPLVISDYVLESIELQWPQCAVELRPQAEGQTLMVISNPDNPPWKVHVLVDTKRHVFLSIEYLFDGEAISTIKYSDFVEVAGAWWAGRIETVNKKDERVSLITLKFTALDTAAFNERMKKELSCKESAVLLREPASIVSDAKHAVAEGKATIDDQITLLVHFARSQQWTRAMQHLEAAEKIAAGKPGMRWIRDVVLKESRRREELKGRLLDEAAKIAKPQAGEAKQQAASDELFLADYLYNTEASEILEKNEMLELLDAIKPVYSRQDDQLHAMKRWQKLHINMLRNVERPDEALPLHAKLAAAYPHDYDLQLEYAHYLWESGEHEAAMDWMKQAIESVKWLPYEAESIRNILGQKMRADGLYPEFLDYMTQWCRKDPDSAQPYSEYLDALIHMDRLEDANKLAASWLKEAQISGKLPPAVSARLSAAIYFALGEGNDAYIDRIEERWLEPLAEAVLFFARHESQSHTADHIMDNIRFQRSDQVRKIRKTIAEILTAQIEKLPAEHIQSYINWLMPNDPAIEPAVWKKLSADLQKRWSAETKPRLKDDLSGIIVHIITMRISDPKELLDFLRLQCQQGPKEYRGQYYEQLFDALTGQPWSVEYEDEAISLLGKLGDPENQTAVEQLAVQVRALHNLTDRMVAARYSAKMKAIEHPEKLPRTELAAKQMENQRKAREEFADRLAKLTGAGPHPSPLPRVASGTKGEGTLVPWITAERLYLDVSINRNLKKAAEDCWERLGAQPNKASQEKSSQDDKIQLVLDQILENRHLTMLCNLAARKDAEPALIERLLKYLDAGMALDASDLRWKLLKYELLVALDRPKDLEQALREWNRTEGSESRWRISLAYLLAEQGKLDEAIKIFETVADEDELGPNEYRSLADWYMAVNRRSDHDKAVRNSYMTQQEDNLSNMLNRMVQPWQRNDGKMPTELDPEVLTLLSVLYEKSSSPQNYVWRTQELYVSTRDFRILTGLADAVVGHTAERIYPFLQTMHNSGLSEVDDSVLSEVKDEATVDSLIEHLTEVREKAKTTVDQRALDLLELMCERRAAELLNQPGPHAEKALASMQRAFRREWSPGERRLMADFLQNLDRISQSNLAAEQISQLQTLHRQEAKGTPDRLHVAKCLAQCLANYARHTEAIDLLSAAIDEREEANGGVLPASANGELSALVSFCEQRLLHARGESVLLKQIKHPANRQQKYWLIQRLYSLYNSALGQKGNVSLGSGSELYKTVEQRIIADLDEPDQNHRIALMSRLCDLYQTAHSQHIPTVAVDIQAFASKKLPEVLKRQTTNYTSIVRSVASVLHDVAGAREGLAFLIKQIEDEPSWLHSVGEGGWEYCDMLGIWRGEINGLIGDLEPRLLKIVLAELRRELQSHRSRNRNIYSQNDFPNNVPFWLEKQGDFLKEAMAVWDENRRSGTAATYIAEYIYYGWNQHEEAIKILQSAYSDKLLEEDGQAQLVHYLHEQNRHGESIAMLPGMIERWPENIQYRVWLMNAYFHTNRLAELNGALDQTDQFFHQKNRWTEEAMASLASCCLDNRLYEQSVKYYEELIPRRQQSHPNRGIGNGTLSGYYSNLALAYSGLKETAKAVDAACGAIVMWGPREKQRQEALSRLQTVLFQSPDLDAYAAELDKQSAETGLNNPLVRQALGQSYVTRGQYDKAIAQLNIACQLQANDAETLNALVNCYDRQGDKQGAVRQMFQSLQHSRHDIQLYENLGGRLTDLERPKEAERAYTSIVEMLPAESESHQLLAEIRQCQNRWDEAIAQWEQVARLRALEPGGLLGLAAAQIHQKQWDKAADSIAKLRSRTWPGRFSDVQKQIQQLEQQLEQDRKK